MDKIQTEKKCNTTRSLIKLLFDKVQTEDVRSRGAVRPTLVETESHGRLI